jgi:FKBP-type peptidyl-prolyl cis-trans isomerase
MNVGRIRKPVIPPRLRHGSREAGLAIPPQASLIFEVDLLDLR